MKSRIPFAILFLLSTLFSSCASDDRLETPINMTHLLFEGVSSQTLYESSFDLRMIYWGPEPMDLVIDAKIKNNGNESLVLNEDKDSIIVTTSSGREYPVRPWHTADYQGNIAPGETKEVTLKVQTKSLIQHVRKFQVDQVQLMIASTSEKCIALPVQQKNKTLEDS